MLGSGDTEDRRNHCTTSSRNRRQRIHCDRYMRKCVPIQGQNYIHRFTQHGDLHWRPRFRCLQPTLVHNIVRFAHQYRLSRFQQLFRAHLHSHTQFRNIYRRIRFRRLHGINRCKATRGIGRNQHGLFFVMYRPYIFGLSKDDEIHRIRGILQLYRAYFSTLTQLANINRRPCFLQLFQLGGHSHPQHT